MLWKLKIHTHQIGSKVNLCISRPAIEKIAQTVLRALFSSRNNIPVSVSKFLQLRVFLLPCGCYASPIKGSFLPALYTYPGARKERGTIAVTLARA